jgi:hypothetical protein
VELPKGVTFKTFKKWLEEVRDREYTDLHDDDVRLARAHGVGVRKKYGGKTLKQWEALHAKAKREDDRFWNRVRKTPGLEDALRRAHATADDKWGPALCLGPLTGAVLRDRMNRSAGVKQTHKDGKWAYSKPRGQNLYEFSGYASS